MKLRAKLSLLMGTAILPVILAMTFATAWVEKSKIINGIQEKEETALHNWAAVCQQAYALKSDLLLINYLKVLSHSPGVLHAYWADPNDVILIHSDPRFFLKKISVWEGSEPPDAYELRQEVSVGGRKVGTAHIGFSNAYRRNELRAALAGILKTSSWVGGGGFSLGLALAIALAFLLARPIRALARASEQVSQGRLNVRLAVQSQDEVGELTRRFNQMVQRLSELDELKDDFISMVSHDLRSPLAAIHNYADVLKEGTLGSLSEKQNQAMATIIESTKRLSLFISNILDLSKMKAGRLTFNIKGNDIDVILKGVLNLLKASAQIKKVSLHAAIPANLPKVLADPERLEQILNNLIANAIKFTPQQGQVVVSVQLNGESIRFGVKDSGPGIPSESLTKLFQKYERLEESAQQEQKITGTGLGLVISRQMVEKQGGKIWVESEPGKGTTFFFTLPKNKA